MKNFDVFSLKHDISVIFWDTILLVNDAVNGILKKFLEHFTAIWYKHAPIVTCWVRNNCTPWMTGKVHYLTVFCALIHYSTLLVTRLNVMLAFLQSVIQNETFLLKALLQIIVIFGVMCSLAQVSVKWKLIFYLGHHIINQLQKTQLIE